jgi:hypothetical protein
VTISSSRSDSPKPGYDRAETTGREAMALYFPLRVQPTTSRIPRLVMNTAPESQGAKVKWISIRLALRSAGTCLVSTCRPATLNSTR